MSKLTLFIAAALASILLYPDHAYPSLVTDTFSGSAALVTPGNLGDHSGDTYTFNFSTSNACAILSYDLNVTVGGGPVHFDTRGFGDSSGSRDSFQSRTETMSFSISNISVLTLPDFTYVSDSIDVGLVSFDLVNNGPNSPRVAWSDDLGGSGLYTSSGTSSGHTETVNITAGAQVADLLADRNWMWINNVVSTYGGSVTVLHNSSVPEPSSCLMFMIGLVFSLTRRRENIRIQVRNSQ